MPSKLAYIIPGFDELSDQNGYKAIQALFKDWNIEARIVRIGWKHRTVTSYRNEFLKIVKHKEVYCIFGFSLGAMVAAVSAPVVNPAHLVLASLSPFFKEDRSHFTDNDHHTLGMRRLKDFNKISFPAIAKQIKSATHILAGSAESMVLIKRCKIAQQEINTSSLTMVPDANHSLSHWRYRHALKSLVKTLN